MSTGDVNGMSIVQPSAGLYDYGDLRALLKKKLSSDPVIREEAPIAVVNASGVTGLAQAEADKLEAANYTIASVLSGTPNGNAPYTLYQIGSGNSGTAGRLKQRYNVKITSGKPPVTVDSSIKFVLVIGPRTTDTTGQ
jgi:hypothetical protein